MNYLLYGSNKFLIDKEIDNIIKKHNIDSLNISNYDLSNDSIKTIIENADTTSLFSDNKLIIINNASIFNRGKTIDNIELLENYLNNSNEATIIIFINHNDTIDNTKKLTKAIKKNGIIKDFIQSKDITSIVKDMFDDYKIDRSLIDLIIKKVGNNLDIIYNEVEKLKIYKIDEKVITKTDIDNLVSENVNVDIFKFVDDIINKNKKEALSAYKKLLILNEEPIKLVSLIASKFRLMYQANVLSKKGYTEKQIAEILKVHPYPVKLALTTGYKYNPKLLLKYINDLADLDIGIKSGEKDKDSSLELFILSL